MGNTHSRDGGGVRRARGVQRGELGPENVLHRDIPANHVVHLAIETTVLKLIPSIKPSHMNLPYGLVRLHAHGAGLGSGWGGWVAHVPS